MTDSDRPVFLVGFMGAGKSAVGRALAARLSRKFVDLDDEVERAEGRAIARLFAECGEERFREAEERALAALGDARGLVVATGGGAFTRAAARRRMLSLGTTVWLDVPLEVACARVGTGRDRPAWISTDPAALRALYDRRRAVYALANVRIDAARSSADDLARVLAVRVAPGNSCGH